VYITRRGGRGRGGLARPIPHPLPPTPSLRSALVGSLRQSAPPPVLPPPHWYCSLSISFSFSPSPWRELANCQIAVQLLCSLTRFACPPRVWAVLQLCVQRRRRRDGVGGQGRGHPRHGHLLPAQLRAPGTIATSVSRAPDSHSLPPPSSAGFVVVGDTGQARTFRLFHSEPCGQATWAPAPHALCVIPLRLRWLFTVAAGFSLPPRLLFPSFPAGVSVSGQRERDGGRPPRLQPHRHCCRANCLVCVGLWVISKYRVPYLTAYYQGT
jgi:hypothetical protein